MKNEKGLWGTASLALAAGKRAIFSLILLDESGGRELFTSRMRTRQKETQIFKGLAIVVVIHVFVQSRLVVALF